MPYEEAKSKLSNKGRPFIFPETKRLGSDLFLVINRSIIFGSDRNSFPIAINTQEG
jgi:hypothetical protein